MERLSCEESGKLMFVFMPLKNVFKEAWRRENSPDFKWLTSTFNEY